MPPFSLQLLCVNPFFQALYTSSFKLPLCWLRSENPVTELSMLPGIFSLAASVHLE
ncbi:hypothetical protein EDC48_11645 [Gibbsiella quercinecans]|nr:hypothetical protein EDC48_11645 [Gibbsiella quercinecans]